MNIEELKNIAEENAEKNRDYIYACEDRILHTPETGYKEFKTSEFVKSELVNAGAFLKDKIAYTGVKGRIGKEGGMNVVIIGELDAITCPSHPMADKTTGAAHACGHNGQIAVMLGVMKTLSDPRILPYLDGSVTFLAVPAEEMIELEYRKELARQGKIRYYSGKQQLVYENEFDDADICMMIHSQPGEETAATYIGGSSLGFVSKFITFHGKASHAGAAPYNGINALNAAMLSMMNMHVARETFRDEDKVRIHPIIVKGGDVANIVPETVIMENTVRAYNPPALADADEKADLAVKGACIATKATATVESTPGYLPLRQDKNLTDMFAEEAKKYIPEEKIYRGRDMIGSSDIGDIGHLIPTIQPTLGGVYGTAHAKDFELHDKEASLMVPVKILSKMCIELLYSNAEKARKIKEEFVPVYTKKEYLAYLDSQMYTKELP